MDSCKLVPKRKYANSSRNIPQVDFYQIPRDGLSLCIRGHKSLFLQIITNQIFIFCMVILYIASYFPEVLGLLFKQYSLFDAVRRLFAHSFAIVSLKYCAIQNTAQKVFVHQTLVSVCHSILMFALCYPDNSPFKYNALDALSNYMVPLRLLPLLVFAAIEQGWGYPRAFQNCALEVQLQKQILSSPGYSGSEISVYQHSQTVCSISTISGMPTMRLIGNINGIYKKEQTIYVFQKYHMTALDLNTLSVKDIFLPYAEYGFDYVYDAGDYLYAISRKLPNLYQINIRSFEVVWINLKFFTQNIKDMIVWRDRYLLAIAQDKSLLIVACDLEDTETDCKHYKIAENLKTANFYHSTDPYIGIRLENKEDYRIEIREDCELLLVKCNGRNTKRKAPTKSFSMLFFAD